LLSEAEGERDSDSIAKVIFHKSVFKLYSIIEGEADSEALNDKDAEADSDSEAEPDFDSDFDALAETDLLSEAE